MTADRKSATQKFSPATGRPSPRAERSRDIAFSGEVARILDDICRERERNTESARAAAWRLVTLLTSPVAAEPVAARGGLAPWQTRKIERYLKEHFTQPVRGQKLAEQVSLSVSHFYRAFKQTFGETPHAYVTRLRLEMAQELMLNTNDPLIQIALASGFKDPSHFSKLFRRCVGETPTAWRRQNLTEARVETRRARRDLIGVGPATQQSTS